MISVQWSVGFSDHWQLTTDHWVGAVAQLGERLVCNQEATGSIPVSSTRKIGDGGAMQRFLDSVMSLGPLLIPIVAVLVGGAIAITAMILKHQERIAKIERGIDPDASPRG